MLYSLFEVFYNGPIVDFTGALTLRWLVMFVILGGDLCDKVLYGWLNAILLVGEVVGRPYCEECVFNIASGKKHITMTEEAGLNICIALDEVVGVVSFDHLRFFFDKNLDFFLSVLSSEGWYGSGMLCRNFYFTPLLVDVLYLTLTGVVAQVLMVGWGFTLIVCIGLLYWAGHLTTELLSVGGFIKIFSYYYNFLLREADQYLFSGIRTSYGFYVPSYAGCALLFSNVFGLVAFGRGVSMSVWTTIGIIGGIMVILYLRFAVVVGERFLKLVLPAGTPYALAPLVAVLEIISYAIRGVAMPLRLFANTFAGHVLLGLTVSACLSGWQLIEFIILADVRWYVGACSFPMEWSYSKLNLNLVGMDSLVAYGEARNPLQVLWGLTGFSYFVEPIVIFCKCQLVLLMSLILPAAIVGLETLVIAIQTYIIMTLVFMFVKDVENFRGLMEGERIDNSLSRWLIKSEKLSVNGRAYHLGASVRDELNYNLTN